MQHMDLAGLRYSSSKPPNPSWLAHGAERGGALVVDGVEHVGATVIDRLAREVPRVLGIDAPFGVPTGLARRLVPLATNGSQVIDHLVVTASQPLDAAWAAFATEHPGALRLTDAITHGAPSVTQARPPLWRTLRGVAHLLSSLRERVAVLPFDTLELVPSRATALEVQPGATLRLLGLPYALRHGPDGAGASSTDLTEERVLTLARLPESLAPLGLRVELPPHVVNLCAQDAGDALDAVLALVTVYLATRGHWTPPPLAGVGAARALTEGWIVRPG